jgi:hypothetical protein
MPEKRTSSPVLKQPTRRWLTHSVTLFVRESVERFFTCLPKKMQAIKVKQQRDFALGTHQKLKENTLFFRLIGLQKTLVEKSPVPAS